MQWDVNNEMLHGSFFADREGLAIRDWMYLTAASVDPGVDLFVNDFDAVENGQLTQVSYRVISLKLLGKEFLGKSSLSNIHSLKCLFKRYLH